MQEVVRLQEHVAELGVADPLIAAFQPRPHGVLADHLVDAEELADVAQELGEPHLAQPGRIVHEGDGAEPLVGSCEEVLDLGADGRGVALQRSGVEQDPFLVAAAGVADQAGPAADQSDHTMTGELKPAHVGELQQAADVQAVGRRVKADVRGEKVVVELVREVGRGRLVDQPAPRQVVRERGPRHTCQLRTRSPIVRACSRRGSS